MSEVINGMRVEIVPDPASGSEFMANFMMERVTQDQARNCLVPTGRTFEKFYALIASEPPSKFKGRNWLNWDEYCVATKDGYETIDPEDPQSFKFYMQTHILSAVPTIRSFFPSIENRRQPGRYDNLIRAIGGIDLAISGLGRNGHLGFNEPDSPFNSVTRLIRLTEETRAINQGPDPDKLVPPAALTAGLATYMTSLEAVTVAFGATKAPAVRGTIYDGISPALPATITRLHHNHLLVVDEAAASLL